MSAWGDLAATRRALDAEPAFSTVCTNCGQEANAHGDHMRCPPFEAELFYALARAAVDGGVQNDEGPQNTTGCTCHPHCGS